MKGRRDGVRVRLMFGDVRTVAVVLAIGAVLLVRASFAQVSSARSSDVAVVTGALADDTGRPLAHADVQACSSVTCLFGTTDAAGSFRFELPVKAAPFVIKTLEDAPASPKRGAALAPVRLSGGAHIDMGVVYVPALPVATPYRPGVPERVMTAGDGLELTIQGELTPPPGTLVAGLAARRLTDGQIPSYDLPADETVVAVYALSPVGTRSASPMGVRVPSALPAGTRVRLRTIDEIDGTFSQPAFGRATGTHIVTDEGAGVTRLTHLVITR